MIRRGREWRLARPAYGIGAGRVGQSIRTERARRGRMLLGILEVNSYGLLQLPPRMQQRTSRWRRGIFANHDLPLEEQRRRRIWAFIAT
jgi:hypothetical protein